MNLKKRLLRNCRVYVILDRETLGKRSIFSAGSAIKDSRPCIVQYRDKTRDKGVILRNALELRKLFSKSNIVFIVNDYIDVAKVVDADGIHLGQCDLSVEIARRILGKDKIIGVSCNSLKQARQAQARGADYIGLGPVFLSPVKPGRKAIGLKPIRQVSRYIRIPVFVIGGINQDNVKQVSSSGAKRIAVCRAVCRAKDARQAVRELDDAIRIRKK